MKSWPTFFSLAILESIVGYFLFHIETPIVFRVFWGVAVLLTWYGSFIEDNFDDDD